MTATGQSLEQASDSPGRKHKDIYDIDQWPTLLDEANMARPAALSSAQVAELQDPDEHYKQLIEWNRFLGTYDTVQMNTVAAEIRELLEHNLGQPAQGRLWLPIDGPSLVGKTTAVLDFALKYTQERWDQYGRWLGDAEHIPVVLVGASSSARQVLTAICEFIGASTVGYEYELIRRLRKLLPEHGTRLVIIDNANKLRRQSADSFALTETLHEMVTGLAVTFVFVGIDLESTALLRASNKKSYKASLQLRNRMWRNRILQMPALGGPEQAADWEQWTDMCRALEQNVILHGAAQKGMLSADKIAGYLHRECGGRIGTLNEWTRQAATHAAKRHAIRIEKCDWTATGPPPEIPDESKADLA